MQVSQQVARKHWSRLEQRKAWLGTKLTSRPVKNPSEAVFMLLESYFGAREASIYSDQSGSLLHRPHAARFD